MDKLTVDEWNVILIGLEDRRKFAEEMLIIYHGQTTGIQRELHVSYRRELEAIIGALQKMEKLNLVGD